MKTFEEIWPELQSELLPLEEKRQDVLGKVKKTRKMLYILLPIAAVLTFLLYGAAGGMAALILGGLMAIGLGVYYYFSSYRYQVEFKEEFKNSVITSIIRGVNPNLSYAPNSHVSMTDYHNSRLYERSVDRYKGEDYVEGVVGETKLRFSELHTEYKTETRDSNGNRRTSWHTIFKGIFMIADSNKHFESETYIIRGGKSDGFFGRIGKALQSKKSRGGERTEMDDPEFNKEFTVYTTDSIEARYLLTPDFMKRMLDLIAYTKAALSASFVDDQLNLAITTAHDFFRPDLNVDLTQPEGLEVFYKELKFLLEIIEVLDLNTRIWSKN